MKKKHYYIYDLIILIIFIVLKKIVEYYWHEHAPFGVIYLILIMLFILATILNNNLDLIYEKNKLLYVLAKTFIFGSFGSILGAIIGLAILIPVLPVGGEAMMIMFLTYWILILFSLVGSLIGFGISLKKI
ncbi:MAG TPA: hypothetical protein DCX95_03550 [Elusimicrobia bacterium]|nr:hypothetical protein [Elusimicrobiota bacterium]